MTILTLIVLAGLVSQVVAGPVVQVLNGTYEGYNLPAYGQDVFLGMPYAQPPEGILRFRAPQSLNVTWNGVKPAVAYSDVCMQYVTPPGFPMSEDCLTLNVVRPSEMHNQSLPVAVWIHGGGLYSGSSAATNLSNFVTQATKTGKPLIAVSINYRLTAFGFLWGNSSDILTNGSANNGLRDQRLALQWIQENIKFFGGDSSRVTIWGESSGALSVGKHLIAYGGRDDNLFRAAIMESGSMVEKWPYNIKDPVAYTADLYRNLTETTGCSNKTGLPADTTPLECLRALNIEALSAALNVSHTPVFSGTGLGPWLTQVDGDILKDGPTDSLDKGHFVNVPILYSTNTDEATVFGFSGPVNSDEDFRAFVAAGGPDNATINIIEILYPDVNAVGLPAGYEPTPESESIYGKQWKREVAFHTDAVETASRRKVLDTWAAAGGTAYSTRINLLPLGQPAAIGSSHAVELAFVFNNVDGSGYNDELRSTSALMSRVWASFVSDLNPNHHKACGVPNWQAWNTTNSDGVGTNFVFNSNGTVGTSTTYLELDDYRLAQTRYLNSIMETQMYY
ncbi:Carboxylic ester hydrolase [Pleurostoma richardsiae]|uniref:Carboxylic ester hydrolase n=1 Tax=Pleurostoma richardsiae TaxID=41990 RepID=A0AA38S0S0_9PEZI|nr:Carboxylic ester hydrolase [Pleurostoma richardsiae]